MESASGCAGQPALPAGHETVLLSENIPPALHPMKHISVPNLMLPVLILTATLIAGPATLQLADGFKNPRLVLPGVLTVEGPQFDPIQAAATLQSAIRNPQSEIAGLRLIVIVDDTQFVAESLRNFLWVTFTRTNPAADIHGIQSFIENKHWGCRGPLVIDARLKPHHAPPLVEDPEITRRVDALAAPGGPLHGIF